MVCTANDLQAWKDFPKGLRVLLLDHDSNSAAEIRSKLEAMDYVVFTFSNEEEALSAISSEPESFHAAIIEVSASSADGDFKFLETVSDLPTIAISNIHCLNTMMKCIALGAVEFLQKPICEDKLKNIWQHVVHKAFNGRVGNVSESLRPVKESLGSILQLPPEREQKNEMAVKVPDLLVPENDQEHSAGNDKYPAPSTPQLKHGLRSMDDGDCQDHSNGLIEKENGDHDRESKSVETTCYNSMHETLQEVQAQSSRGCMLKEEDESADNSRCENNVPPVVENKNSSQGFRVGADNPSKPSGASNSSGTRVNRKKMKVDWTPDLHKKFVQAVEQLGVDQAIPSRILELMKVEGLTRHNVASHLQKYRMHKRHVLPKDDDRRWHHHQHQHQHRDSMTRSYYPHKPIMAFPPYQSNHLRTGVVYPVWGASTHPASIPVWSAPGYPPWQPAENWPWKHPPGIHADTWGCPVLPPSAGPAFTHPQDSSGCYPQGAVDNAVPWNSFDQHPAEEVIDKVVKEAISKPWLPLPLGLKPPSTDCVLAELSKQGIPSIPPHARGSHTH